MPHLNLSLVRKLAIAHEAGNDRTCYCFLLCVYHYQMSIICTFFVFSQVSNERPQEEKKFKERVKQSMYQQTKV